MVDGQSLCCNVNVKVSSALLCIVRPMLISSPPPYQTVDEWISVVQLECRFSGTPVQVTWHTDSRAITGSVASSTSGNNEVRSWSID